jgi:hypothetical protein
MSHRPGDRASSERIDPMKEMFWSFGDGGESGDGDTARLSENETVRKVIGEDLAQNLVHTLKQIELTAGMLDDAIREHPECAALLNRQFTAFQWWIPRTVSELVYRAHVRELLTRIVNGQALQPATRSEVLTLLRDLAKREGLNRQTAAVFGWLFSELTGLRYPAIVQMIEMQTDVERNQTLAELREQLKCDSRILRSTANETEATPK